MERGSADAADRNGPLMNLRHIRTAATGTPTPRTRGSRLTGPGRRLLRSPVAAAALAGALAMSAGYGIQPAAAATARGAAPARASAATVGPAVPAAGEPDFGPNVYVFTPSMPQSQIQATVDAIASQQISNQFGAQRYALLFEPGTYGSAADPLTFQVGYYTEVAGLGARRATSPSTAPSTCTTSASDHRRQQLHRAGQLLALAVQPDHQRRRPVGLPVAAPISGPSPRLRRCAGSTSPAATCR